MKRFPHPAGFLPLLLLACLVCPPAVAEERTYSQAELDQMLAPIALYPDSVLSHVLIAATHPLDVVQAARWTRDNPGLRGEAAVKATEDQRWDPSVRALTAFPDLLARMSEDLDWTRSLGEAVLVQEESVVDTIQVLRGRAYANGYLDGTEHLAVRREDRLIDIEPASTRLV
jgi:hypothetical protein